MTRRILLIGFISLACISAELLYSLVLGMKAWSHVAYVVIAFALLGYGVGSTLYLIVQRRVTKPGEDLALALSLGVFSIALFAGSHSLPYLALNLTMVTTSGLLSMVPAIACVASPFVAMGFAVTLLFATNVAATGRLYFADLVGAGLGAVVFYPLLVGLGPLPSLAVFSTVGLIFATTLVLSASPKWRWLAAVLALLAVLSGAGAFLREPAYQVDRTMGWEWFPGFFPQEVFEVVDRSWHPMGRTDAHRIVDPTTRRVLQKQNIGVFAINVSPPPEFCYFTNSYRAGTPCYKLSREGLAEAGSTVQPFSLAMEVPYILLRQPRVIVIGAGGGRDVFMATTHEARSVLGAEINPGTWKSMSKGGALYEYSGRLYDLPGVRVENVDGRHLVKVQPSGTSDLIVLNGVDTFAAISTGAYAFAETYLYTREAMQDYLRALSDEGILNLNRWYQRDSPREALRVFVLMAEALRAMGMPRPWEHIVVARSEAWAVMLARKRPFAAAESARIREYLEQHEGIALYTPADIGATPGNPIQELAAAYHDSTEKQWIGNFWADISVVRDDSPFFYKYYRFTLAPTKVTWHPGGGGLAFQVQATIIGYATAFTMLFIGLPLVFFRWDGVAVLRGARLAFLFYFASLGLGFIFIELAMMQNLVMVLGSPIYSISVALATLLIASGVGSLLRDPMSARLGSPTRLVVLMALGVIAYLWLFVNSGPALLEAAMAVSFPMRALLSVAILAPIGFMLGTFFPSGLVCVGRSHPSAVAWAWGINSGFTVIGSTTCIVVAQFTGFRTVLLLASAIYCIAAVSYWRMDRAVSRAAVGDLSQRVVSA